MIAYVVDVHVHVQRIDSVVKMTTVLEEYATEQQRSVVRFLWAKGLNEKGIHKKCFLLTVGSVCFLKRFTVGSRKMSLIRKMLQRRCGSGLDALVKRWAKSINVGGGYDEK
jgi:hypothetical protein